MAAEPPPLAYRVREAARLLGISRSYCYELVWSGELPHARVGHRIVIPAAELVRYLQEHTVVESAKGKSPDALPPSNADGQLPRRRSGCTA